MKGAGKYAEELKALVKKFAKECKIQPLQKQEPLRTLVRAMFSFDTTDAKADEALAIVDREFVDINELRVATELEVEALIGAKYPQIIKRASLISSVMNAIFDREGVLSLDRVSTLKKAEVRQLLKELPGMTPFVEGSVCLLSLDITAMPIDDMGMAYLKQAGALDAAIGLEEAQKFIETHIKPEEVYELYAGLRRLAKENYAPPAPPAPAEETKKKKK